jgi:translation initiation factor IF-2
LGRTDGGAKPERKREAPRPGTFVKRHPGLVSPPPLKQRPGAKDVKKPQQPVVQKPIARPPEALTGNAAKALERLPGMGEAPPPVDVEDDEEGRGKARVGEVVGRDKRHQARADRAKTRKERENKNLRDLLPGSEEDQPRLKKDRLSRMKQKQGGPRPRQGKIPVEMPITVRALSEAIGVRSGDLLFRLMGHGAPPTTTINSLVDPVLAETIALDAGCELDIKRPMNVEEQVLAEQQQPDQPEDLQLRAPVVTIMGHVDHGKTSLLDRIRESDVAATEAGGITQVIRAWRVEHGGRPITFLDTPGHEAFTKMRARGANVTDIAVIVVAADDGVMPQTEEAINHAKAAGVPIVVAINKVDLPNANLNKTRQQLYSMSLIPDTMGGDTPFVETSAATGKGIPELLDMLSLVAELKELKANPNKPARGTCLEANLSEGEGVLATLLIREGTLRRGEVIICGASYGRVRNLYNDLGQPIQEAGPSVPVRITGLDEVPNADDEFRVVPDLASAREIAGNRKEKQQEAALSKRTPMRLESLNEIKVTELKVILKADFRGSIEAIRKELEKLYHEEVRVRILHTGIGAITESDVQLALTSPQDTIIVGFNVVPDDRAKQLADEKGIQIREYDIIYNLTNDIRSALEGKLKPREEIIHLGRAVVRNTFKISRVGTIAGCHVTQGIIERSAKVRLIREGVVIYPPSDRTAGLESLKRYKEDVREVREGFECGLKIAGYDDVKVGDLIEAYRIEQVQRTLE